eukprot:5385382-Prymnesium_polylepis.4
MVVSPEPDTILVPSDEKLMEYTIPWWSVPVGFSTSKPNVDASADVVRKCPHLSRCQAPDRSTLARGGALTP